MKRSLLLLALFLFSAIPALAEYAEVIREANGQPEQFAAFNYIEGIYLLRRNEYCENVVSFLDAVARSKDKDLMEVFEAGCFDHKGKETLERWKKNRLASSPESSKVIFGDVGTCSVKELVRDIAPRISPNKTLRQILGSYCFNGFAFFPKGFAQEMKDLKPRFPVREFNPTDRDEGLQTFMGDEILEEWDVRFLKN